MLKPLFMSLHKGDFPPIGVGQELNFPDYARTIVRYGDDRIIFESLRWSWGAITHWGAWTDPIEGCLKRRGLCAPGILMNAGDALTLDIFWGLTDLRTGQPVWPWMMYMVNPPDEW